MFLFIFLQHNNENLTDGSDTLTIDLDVSDRVLGNTLIDENIKDNDNTRQEFLVIKQLVNKYFMYNYCDLFTYLITMHIFKIC